VPLVFLRAPNSLFRARLLLCCFGQEVSCNLRRYQLVFRFIAGGNLQFDLTCAAEPCVKLSTPIVLLHGVCSPEGQSQPFTFLSLSTCTHPKWYQVLHVSHCTQIMSVSVRSYCSLGKTSLFHIYFVDFIVINWLRFL